ncbi:Uncharacterized protein OS=planctomycete KSU-1 GN=KSU1_D0806 PE=4 SV=1: DUF1264 [Gemmataceae bacterium]|jgi:hypothetical protein|nr:Uncharacterized protein OS=planctomycete KSU-1 GN=KSU1_D0806 PE=4 SV=1: DUF1264 [Gemmataceae bacterium]VTT98713.1 Uncharacterized protein OS=planctomycete KSU-1 GN=KSU1_D0806 PE=4 SV=1: DUF1264 [Gemmataceae bacterium]
MDRREMFAAVGAIGAGTAASAGEPHGKAAAGAGPLTGPHLHFCGIHMAKKNPKLQFVTQHYCAAHTGGADGDVFQCVLFDGTGRNAKLVGVEYLISDAAYRKLPDDEKKFWHAHTYEVLGGGLIAPGMEPKDETAFMKVVLTTWGKAWHTWPDSSTAVPTGEPLLIWSIMGDGQVDPKVLADRDKQFKVDTLKVREARVKEFGLEPPSVSLPKDLNAIGRQWTDAGDDKPTKKN